MVRGGLLAIGFAALLPLVIVVGASLGFYLLWFPYTAFGIDFPTLASILVGLTPIWVMLVGWWYALKHAARR